MRDTFDFPEPATQHPSGLPMIVDSFAGGGGASTGIELALGRSPDVAINHDPAALAMHEANHPDTLHLINSIYAVSPDEVCRGRKVGLAWFSPDCKHHSKAKGGKPVSKGIRDLAWVVVHWAERVAPDVIMLENVEEFQDWGPLTPEDKPDPERKGETFRIWVKRLRRLKYRVEWKRLRACDYGAPTIRQRLFVIARRDGLPITWPEPTHGAPGSAEVITGLRKPWRTAAEIIDWSLPCPSIFDSAEEIMQKHGLRAVRPLKEATLRRIARGVVRYVLEAKEPFIVGCGGRMGQSPERPVTKPIQTLTTKADSCIVAPSLISVSHGYSGGRREYPVDEPIGTMSAGGTQHALVAPHLMTMRNAGKPFTAADEPTHTITAGGAHMMAVAAFLAQHNSGPKMQRNAGRAATAPLSTLTTRGTQQQVVAANMVSLRGTADAQLKGLSIETPVPTISAGGGHSALIATFLQKYYGAGTGQSDADPLHTLSTRDTFGLVTVEIDGTTYAIADIGMRMLTPREQFRAQGFPDSYIIDRAPDGRPMTKTEQTRMCGNSVCPPLAAALVTANCAQLATQEAVA